MALIDKGKRSASARAVENTDVLVLDDRSLVSRIDNADPVLHLFMRVLLERFRSSQRSRLEHADEPGLVSAVRARLEQSGGDRANAVEQLRLQNQLQEAIEQRHLRNHYQAIVSLKTGRFAGFEALCRWTHKERGFVSPAEFIPLAESTGLIVPLGLAALEQATDALEELQGVVPEQDRPLFMSVNISPIQLVSPSGFAALKSALKRVGPQARNLKLEITETLLMRSPEDAEKALGELRETGVGLSIDDFGTGYSSLSYLNRFPIDTLKIDMSFIAAMLEDETSMKIVRAVVSLSHELGLAVVAEGVETKEQLEVLHSLGCQYVQGYYLARPEALDRVCERLRTMNQVGRLWP
jgi:EAL domain-containing protein (putative c-di-GMP-specific phosphodiesterase class I)